MWPGIRGVGEAGRAPRQKRGLTGTEPANTIFVIDTGTTPDSIIERSVPNSLGLS